MNFSKQILRGGHSFPPHPLFFPPRPSSLVSAAPQAGHHSGFCSKKVRTSFSNCDTRLVVCCATYMSGYSLRIKFSLVRSERDAIGTKVVGSAPKAHTAPTRSFFIDEFPLGNLLVHSSDSP